MFLFNLFNLRHRVVVAVVDVFGGVRVVVLLQVRVVVLDTVVWWSQRLWGEDNDPHFDHHDGEEDYSNDGTRDDVDGGDGNGGDDRDGDDGDGTKNSDNDPLPSEATLPRWLNVHVCSILQQFLVTSDFANARIIAS